MLRRRAEIDARTNGCYLNPDPDFLMGLLEGLKRNEERYGYPSCPCRLASGNFELDRDIVCPCDYRDPDVREYGCCYCGLYVSKDVFEGRASVKSIPERRPLEKQGRAYAMATKTLIEKSPKDSAVAGAPPKIVRKMWYCKQCGYVCFREDPPYICPVCKAKREFFEEVKFEG
jgi:ferredoxin-thioredoxin reductase catalytic subunit